MPDETLAARVASLADEAPDTWSVGATLAEARAATTGRVVAAVEAVADAWSRTLGAGERATFYAWHDEQVGQLRLSLTPQPPDALPFGAVVVPTGEADAVVAPFLASPWLEGIPWSAVEPAGADTSDPEPVPLTVFVRVLTGTP